MFNWLKRCQASNDTTASPLEAAADAEAVAAYEKVFAAFLAAVPNGWRQATVHAEIDTDSAEYSTFYVSESNEELDVFIEDNLEIILRALQAHHWTKGIHWYTLHLKLRPSGEFSATFGYEKTKWMLY